MCLEISGSAAVMQMMQCVGADLRLRLGGKWTSTGRKRLHPFQATQFELDSFLEKDSTDRRAGLIEGHGEKIFGQKLNEE